jgi:hypothetical protein
MAWLSIGAEDNVLDRFFRCLLTAWEEVQPGIRESPAGLLLGAMAPDRDAVLSAFINVASGLPEHTVFVLDDYHLIADPAIHQALTFLLDHLPPPLHVVLVGRAEPPLPLARYRARDEVRQVRAADLQFLPDETADVLNELALTLAPAFRIRSAHVFGALADLELRVGRLRGAAAYWRKALAVIEDQARWASLPLPLIGWVSMRMGEILSQGLERAEVGGDVRALIAAYLLAAG